MKFTGGQLQVPYADILQGMKWTIPRPPSDTMNVAQALVRDNCDTALALALLNHRVAFTQELLDDLWPDVVRVADALARWGRLSGDEVAALLAA